MLSMSNHMVNRTDFRMDCHSVASPPDRNADTTQNSEYLLTQIGARAALGMVWG